MKIELKDLLVGDEIIISSGSRLKYLKVLRPIRLNGKQGYWNNTPLYKNVYCAARREETVLRHTKTYPGAKDYKRIEYVCSPESNIEIYQNLNGKTIWLVKREKR